MELRLLRTFAAVAELRHFARAADRCNLSQPAVSHQIRVLEEELGTRLLNRADRRVSLTVAGELFLEDARRILAAVERARERVQSISSGTTGRVRIGATDTAGLYLLPGTLARYRHEHPEFALQFTIAPEADILERVAANDLDMGLVAGKPALGELQGRRVARDALVFVAATASPWAKARRMKPADVRDAAWVLREDGSDTRRQLDGWFRRHHLTPSRVMTLHGPDAVKRAVIAGLGIALLARVVVADELRDGRLAALNIMAPPSTRDVLVVDHPQKHHGAACRAMLALLV
jgi:LysR family transcriptional regulator, transcriptional activator of the cysJI operon